MFVWRTALIFWIMIAFVICLVPGPDVVDKKVQGKANASNGEVQQEAPKEISHSTNTEEQSATSETNAGQRPTAHFNDEHSTAVDGTPANRAISSFLTENVRTKEWLGHFIPMVGIGFWFLRLPRVRRLDRWKGVLFSVLFSSLAALIIEFAQMLLPVWFHRGFAWADIGVSLFGGFAGALAGLLFKAEPQMHAD
jgi:hypothetical protein